MSILDNENFVTIYGLMFFKKYTKKNQKNRKLSKIIQNG